MFKWILSLLAFFRKESKPTQPVSFATEMYFSAATDEHLAQFLCGLKTDNPTVFEAIQVCATVGNDRLESALGQKFSTEALTRLKNVFKRFEAEIMAA